MIHQQVSSYRPIVHSPDSASKEDLLSCLYLIRWNVLLGADAYPPSQSALAVAAMQSTLEDRVTEFDQPVQPRRDANMMAEDAELLLLLVR